MSKKISILIIDDDKYFRLGVRETVECFGPVEECSSQTEAFQKLESNYYDLVIIDMQLDFEDSGIQILRRAREKNIHSIILSSSKEPELIEKAYQEGAGHFFSKLKYRDNITIALHQFIQKSQNGVLENFIQTEFITKNQKLIDRLQSLSEMNLKDKTLYLSGETGVGKTLVGKFLHQFISHKNEPFIHLNCSEIAENLLESELFGHVKGAFTGADKDKKGKLELADTGVLFLDEIATMSLPMQQKLLKAIEEKTFFPVGSSVEKKVQFTLITATCEDLEKKVHEGTFRQDLYFRITGVKFHIPSLKERKEDIPSLIEYFLNISPRRFVIKDCALNRLSDYQWPGNIRELKKVIELLSLSSKGIIYEEDVCKIIQNKSLENDFLMQSQKNFIKEYGLNHFISKIEEEITQEVLAKHNGKVTHCIKELKISTSAFYRILEKVKV